MGDVLIWEGTNEFLKKCRCTCLYKSSLEHYRFFKCSTDVTILLQGGGNFGDIWRLHQDFRLKIISEYPNNRIIILPQSVFYENEKNLKEDALFMANHKDLFICARDDRSYKILNKYFSLNNILLLPDMAFCISEMYLNQLKSIANDKALFLKRMDKELCLNKQIIFKNKLEVDIRDWPCMERISKVEWFYFCLNRLDLKVKHLRQVIDWYMSFIFKPFLIRKGVKFVSSYRYIYTTRLHVAILALLLHKPFVFLDNSYGKNSDFYKTWLSDLPEIDFI